MGSTISFSGSTVFNGKTFLTTKVTKEKAHKNQAWFHFVYFVSFVVELFPAQYGRAVFPFAYGGKQTTIV